MRALYSQSSFGWNPTHKLAELFDPLSRFFLVYLAERLIAFVMFRFEHEDDEDVLYCYDIQISLMHRRVGLGKRLIQLLEVVGKDMGMDKIMLTVLKENRNAVDFYASIGFAIDKSSPVENTHCLFQVNALDYMILSKILPKDRSKS